jgi:hypothetical protein
MKHRLAEKSSPDGHSVEPSHERAVPPGFDRMGDTLLVQRAIALRNLLVDPAAGIARIASRLGARADDIGKCAIDRDLEATASNYP